MKFRSNLSSDVIAALGRGVKAWSVSQRDKDGGDVVECDVLLGSREDVIRDILGLRGDPGVGHILPAWCALEELELRGGEVVVKDVASKRRHDHARFGEHDTLTATGR